MIEIKQPNRKDYRCIKILANVLRIVTFPIFLIIRIYFWVWDYDFYEKFH